MYFCSPFTEKSASIVRWYKIITTILLLSLVVACGRKGNPIEIIPQSKKNHLQAESLRGQIKQICEKKYYPSDSVQASDSLILGVVTYKYYSADGFLNRSVILDDHADTVSVRTITYDDHAKMLEEVLFDKRQSVMQRVVYEYDKYGYRTKESVFVEDNLLQELRYRNDAYGNVEEIIIWQGGATQKMSYVYNEVGLPLRVNEYDPDGQLFKYITFEYDNYGDLVNKVVYRKDGVMVEYSHTQMNAKGEWQKQVYECMLPGLNFTEVRTYSEHDAHGNWQKMVKKIDDKVQLINTRIIEYY